MKRRDVGILIIGIALLMGFIIFSFNQAMSEIVGMSCSHGPECPMWSTIEFQTNVSLGIMIFVIFLGIYLVFSKTESKNVDEKPKKDNSKIMNNLEGDEKLVMEKVIDSDGTIYQSQIVEDTGFPKVKVTRILDRLEGKGLIERRRRGMTNVVILKHEK